MHARTGEWGVGVGRRASGGGGVGSRVPYWRFLGFVFSSSIRPYNGPPPIASIWCTDERVELILPRENILLVFVLSTWDWGGEA